jgi:hypothetical protein
MGAPCAHRVGQPFQADVRLESLTYLVAAEGRVKKG